jgi:hypothetical protein
MHFSYVRQREILTLACLLAWQQNEFGHLSFFFFKQNVMNTFHGSPNHRITESLFTYGDEEIKAQKHSGGTLFRQLPV